LTRRYDHNEADDFRFESFDGHAEERMIIQKSVTGANALESISLQDLRYISSNPAIHGISSRLGQRRLQLLTPSLALIEMTGFHPPPCMMSGSGVKSSAFGSPLDIVHGHPVHISGLGSAAISTLVSHQAARASVLVSLGGDSSAIVRNDALRVMTTLSRFLEGSEALEHVAANDFMLIPLNQLGRSMAASSESESDD
jgi:hypothetical protein